MPRVTPEEYEASATEFRRRAKLAEEKGEELRKKLEPKLVEEGHTGAHVYVDVHTGRYVIGQDYEEAARKAKDELGQERLCWGFDVGIEPRVRIGISSVTGESR